MTPDDRLKLVEAFLVLTDRPLTTEQIAGALQIPKEEAEKLISEYSQWLRDRGAAYRLREVAGGWQLASLHEHASFFQRLHPDKMVLRLTRPALETLSVLAYKGPLTRAEVDQIRGTDCTTILANLVERGLVKIVGRKKTIGTPYLYDVSEDFFRRFGLKDRSDLPLPAEKTDAGT